LVERPKDWPGSSFRHYATGGVGPVEIVTVDRTTQGTRRDHADVELAKWTIPVWADSAAPPTAVFDGGNRTRRAELETDTLTHPSTFFTVSLLFSLLDKP
jgi:hypothetical protein